MTWSRSFALLGLLQLGQAMPKQPDYALYSPVQVGRRQSPEQAVGVCPENTCQNSCLSASTGPGFPLCAIYQVQELKDRGFPTDQNGLTQAWISVPPLDAGCRVIVRSPVFDTACAGTDLVAVGQTCAPVRVENNYGIFFCCGTGDCSSAGIPRRETSRNPFSVFRSFGSLSLFDADGTPLPLGAPLLQKAEYVIESVESAASEVSERSEAAPEISERSEAESGEIEKRQEAYCDDFVPFGDPFVQAGVEAQVSDLITCGSGGSQPCQIRADRSNTQSFTVTTTASVSLAWKIVSGSVGGSLAWQETNSRSFGETFGIDPGVSGYIAFVPRLMCIQGQFIGRESCTVTGELVTACGPSTGVMEGDVRLVQYRG